MNFRYLHHSLIGLLLLVGSAAVPAADINSYPSLGPGLKYTHERCGDEPLSIHILQIDRCRPDFQFITTLAHNTIFGLSPLSEQVKSIPPALGRPVAAVNGDFFAIRPGPYQGDPCGLQIWQGELVSSPSDGPVFWIDRAGQPQVDIVKSDLEITWPGGEDETVKIPFTVNQLRQDDRAVLYTSTLGNSTHTTGGLEILLEPLDKHIWGALRPNQTLSAKIQALRWEGNTPLAPGRMILSVGPALAAKLPAVKPGDRLTLSTQMTPVMDQVNTAIGSIPLLLRQGKRQPLSGSLATVRHPRTFLGWNKKYIYWGVVDGRREDLSRGMSLPELTDLMLRLGCTEALNLDGGGSSTFWLGGQVLNAPSDRRERPIANGLILLRKPQPQKPNIVKH